MDYLWTPWRYRYIADASKDDRCIFCDALAANDDSKTLIVLRGAKNFVILNRYPYTSGHVMVVPYEHVADFAAADPDTLAEMMRLAQRVQTALANTYHPRGLQPGHESRPRRGRRRHGASALARASALGRRREFHDRGWRNARRAGRTFDHV